MALEHGLLVFYYPLTNEHSCFVGPNLSSIKKLTGAIHKVEIELVRWRNCSPIHTWFTKNTSILPSGMFHVSFQTLRNLYADCLNSLTCKEYASRNMPCKNIQYNYQSYVNVIKKTIEHIEPVVNEDCYNCEEYSFVYYAQE